MKQPPARLLTICTLLLTFVLAACDIAPPTDSQATTATTEPATVTTPAQFPVSGAAGQDSTPTGEVAASTPGALVTDAVAVASPTAGQDAPAPTVVTATSMGLDMTALQALAVLKPKALAWQADARLGLLSNVRPGQQKNLLGDALGKPEINEPTPNGKGRDWTLVAFSPGAHGAIAIGMDGTQVDLVKAGAVTADTINQFAGTATASLSLNALDVARLVDSDRIAEAARKRGRSGDIGMALLSPDGLGLGPLPAPQTGGAPPQIAYELFRSDSYQQTFIFFDANTGAVVLDSSAP